MRRRDLISDVVGGLFVTILLLYLTAGLAVLALIAVPLAGVLIAISVIEYRRRRSSSRARPRGHATRRGASGP